MTVDYIKEKDLSELRASNDPLVVKLGENIEKWIDKGYTTAGQCVVFKKDGFVVGGMVFTSFEEQELEVMDFACAEIESEQAAMFLKQSIDIVRDEKHRSVCYNLYNTDSSFEKTQHIFLQAGFFVEQEKKQYELKDKELPQMKQVLEYKSLAESGMDAYICAIAEVTRETKDSLMRKDAHNLGETKAARRYAESLISICSDTSLWRLAYINKSLAGLVVPQYFDSGLGIINYIGVVPCMRGNAYGYELLLHGSRLLLDFGATKIIADIDKENIPLEQALIKAGYIHTLEELVLTYPLILDK